MLPETHMVHLYLFCEHIERIHVVENKKGEEISLIDPKAHLFLLKGGNYLGCYLLEARGQWTF